MRKLSILSSSLVFPVFLLPRRSFACLRNPKNNVAYVEILGLSPQVGIAGVTQVYIYGTCFGSQHGDGAGVGYITLSNSSTTFRVPDTSISEWSDAEIIFTLPFGAISGDLTVYTAYTDSEPGDTAVASTYCAGGQSWCGNGTINATFQALSPDNPAFTPLSPGTGTCPPTNTTPCPRVLGLPYPSQYVEGTWSYNDGVLSGTLTLTQGQENSNGTWPLSGTFNSNYCTGSQVSGTLDQYGGITLSFLCVFQIQAEWQVLGSGDVTSNGYWSGANDCPAMTGNGLLADLNEQADPPSWTSECSPPPLFKTQTDEPASETPEAVDWVQLYGSTLPTYGQFERTLPLSSGGFNEFAGRFLFEVSGGAASDSCYFPTSNYPHATSATSGAGWYVGTNNQWGYDTIGVESAAVTYYQNYWGPQGLTCSIGGPQQMFTDGRTGPPQNPYTTNFLIVAQIAPTKLYTAVQVQSGTEYEECENYPSLKGHCH